jgi:hypothetical protein
MDAQTTLRALGKMVGESALTFRLPLAEALAIVTEAARELLVTCLKDDGYGESKNPEREWARDYKKQ